MADDILISKAGAVLDRARAKGFRIATAESCTGGLIAASLTEIAGSSDVFERGFVTYSNEAKTELLGVSASLIAEQGAVSEQVARAMAEGALAHSRADMAVAVTGIAGPGGGSADKPVGLVFIGAARRGQPAIVERHVFDGDRTGVRHATVARALEILLSLSDG
ncbi:MAG: CinA family protein [Alphaproteobacteria bacterium]|nr:CinA family protein [Alphaproteobacteria bacterium]